MPQVRLQARLSDFMQPHILLRLKILIVFSFLLSGLIVGCQTRKSVESRTGVVIADSDSYEASLFRSNCAICHGAEGTGKEVNGRIVPSLRVGHPTTLPKEEIYRQIKFGKMPMPPFKDQLSEKEIRGLADFIYNDIQARGGK